MALSPIAEIMALLAIASAIYPVIHLNRQIEQPGAKCMLMLCVVCASFPLAGLILPQPYGLYMRYAISTPIAPFYFLAIVGYLRIDWPGRRIVEHSLSTYCAVMVAWAVLPSPWHDIYLQLSTDSATAGSAIAYTAGLGAWIMKTVSYLLIVVAASLAIYRFSASRTISAHVTTLVVLPVLVGVADYLSVDSVLSTLGFSYMQIASTAGMFFLSYSLNKHRLWERAPVSRSLVLGHVRDPVCVVSDSGEISDCNKAFADFARTPIRQLLNTPVTDRLPTQLRNFLQAGSGNEYEFITTLGTRTTHYQAIITELQPGVPCSTRLLTLSDVTEEKTALASLARSEAALREANEQLEQLSYVDTLTGLFNKRYIADKLAEFEQANISFGLIKVSIDQFEKIKETHGSAAGEAVLIALGRAMESTCRRTDVIARIGGKEFAILAEETSDSRLRLAAERLHRHIRRTPVKLDNGVTLQATASIGATMMRRGQSVENLMSEADQLLNQAISSGRDCVRAGLDALGSGAFGAMVGQIGHVVSEDCESQTDG